MTDRPARLAVSGDVVTIDAVVAEIVGVGEAGELADQYRAQADWDPRSAGERYACSSGCVQNGCKRGAMPTNCTAAR